MVTERLTDFQRLTEAELNNSLSELGLALVDRDIEGVSEPFITGRIRDVTVWIYVNGACVIGPGVDRVYEKWDFLSLEELRRAFIDKVRAQFEGAAPEEA